MNKGFMQHYDNSQWYPPDEHERYTDRKTAEGQHVYRQLHDLFKAPVVAPECREMLQNFPDQVFNQLAIMNVDARFGPYENNNQFSYEVRMMDFVVKNAEKIIKLILPRETDTINLSEINTEVDRSNVIGYLLILITLSDIGKIGPTEYDEHAPNSIIARIYNHAIFHKPHQDWLTGKGMDSNIYSYTISEALAIAQHTIVENLCACVRQTTMIERFLPFRKRSLIKALSKKGIRINDYVTFATPHMPKMLKSRSKEQVALILDDVAELYVLSDEEKEALVQLGFDPSNTRIIDFFTKAHIRFGPQFISSVTHEGDDLRHISTLAAAHHFAQGDVPKELDSLKERAKADMLDQSETGLLRMLAFLEILDKVDARVNRSDDPVDEAVSTMQNVVSKLSGKNYNATVQAIYDDIFNGLIDMNVASIDARK